MSRDEEYEQHSQAVQNRLQQGSATQAEGYRDLFESAPSAYLLTDVVGTIQVANQAAAALLAIAPTQLPGQCWFSWIAAEDRDCLVEQSLQVQEQQTILREVRLHTPHNQLLYAAINLNGLYNNQSQLVGLRWLLRDITPLMQRYQHMQQTHAELQQQVEERKAELQKVLKFESMLKRITDKVRDSLDESQILQAAVQELTLILGLAGCNAALYDLDQGTSTIRYEHTSSIPASRGKVAQMGNFPEIYQQLQQGYFFQFCSLMPNPARGQVAMLACPIFLDPNSSQGVAQAVLGDLWLIHRKDHIFNEFEIRLVQQVANQCAIAIRQARLYQAAQGQVQELEMLNRLKDEFLSTVSHELRTPIANVKMAIQMLKLSITEERKQKYLDILEKESAREAELINDLLDLQRLETATQALKSEPIPLQEWLPSLVEPFQIRMQNQQQVFQLSCTPDLPTLYSDAAILRRILAELLNNACKYTAAGGIISLTAAQESEPLLRGIPPTITFTVRNQAEIPVTELPRIFEKFYRCLNADPWSQGGTGLGLALVQKLVEQLHGAIQVDSAEGWTCFVMKLPQLSDVA